MSHSLRQNPLNIWAIGCTCVSRERIVVERLGGGLRDVEDVCPLFDFFLEVLGVESRIAGIFVRYYEQIAIRRTDAVPCQNCTEGRGPVYPGYPARTRSP